MAFVHGKDGKVMMNDASVSADIRQWSVSHKRGLADTTALQDSGVKSIVGLFEGSISLQGHFDSTAGRLIDTLTDAANAGADKVDGVDNDLLITVLPEGDTIGLPALFAACDLEEIDVESEVDDSVKVSVEGIADNMVDVGFSQRALAAQSPGTSNSTSIDNATSSTNGGAGIIHVTAVSGGGNLVAKIQHSTDNSVWVDLITFTTATAKTYQRSEVAAGTTVNRYVRATGTATTGTYTWQASFARR